MRVTKTVRDEAKKFNVALEHVPEFSAQVGVLISCFALVEVYVPHLVNKLTGMPFEDAWTIVNSYQSFSYRIGLLEDLLANRDPKTDTSAYRHFISTLSTANSLRNRYAHAQYSVGMRGQDGRREVILQPFASTTRKKAKRLHLHLKDINADVATMKLIICDLHAFVHRDEQPLT